MSTETKTVARIQDDHQHALQDMQKSISCLIGHMKTPAVQSHEAYRGGWLDITKSPRIRVVQSHHILRLAALWRLRIADTVVRPDLDQCGAADEGSHLHDD